MSARRVQPASRLWSLRTVLVICAVFLAGIWLGRREANPQRPAISLAGGSIQVYFSPDGGATRKLVSLIDSARKSVEVQAYSFTSRPLIRALITARRRGVAVTIILDRSHVERKNYRTRHWQRKISAALQAFYSAGIPTYIDDRYLIAHNKIMLIDGQTITTGSFNFSYAAAHFNAENMLVIQGVPALFARYQKNFAYHVQTSQLYKPGLVLEHQFHWPRRQ